MNAPAHNSVKGGASLVGVSEVELGLVLGFLRSESLIACTEVCRALNAAVIRSDELWRQKCLEDWGEGRRVLPSDRGSGAVTARTYLEAWRAWRKSFDGYDLSSVRRVAVWWAGIEEWMSRELPEVEASLNPGVTEAELDRAEEMLGWPLPTNLRLLYRFHNGQWLPWDRRLDANLGVDEGQPANPADFSGSGMSLGLLGGYCFYNRMITCKLFSLQRGVLAGLATCDAMDGEHKGYFQANAMRWGADLDAVRARGGFLLAASHDNMSKRAWVGKDGNVRFDPKVGSLLGVFNAAPVATPDDDSAGNGESGGEGGDGDGAVEKVEEHGVEQCVSEGRRKGQPGGNLMTWLEEYLRRLRCGHYVVKARWPDRQHIGDEPLGPGGHPIGGLGGGGSSRLERGIWLFPEEPGVGCVTDVTKGVEVQVSPVFVPEESSDWRDLLWAYSVRMRLLRDHPSRPQSMTSCQLSTRHWEMDGPQGFHREVSGDGVIGLYPLLKIPESPSANPPTLPPEPFEYRSCTVLDHPPGTMGGYFNFTPGSTEQPTGSPFRARVPTFDLVLPDFIF